MALIEALLEILNRPTIDEIVVGMIMFLGPVWMAFFVGIIVGWAWKPRWASFGNCKNFDISAPSSPSALIPSPVKDCTSVKNLNSTLTRTPSFGSYDAHITSDKDQNFESANCSLLELKKKESVILNDEDLEHLCHLVERKDGGPPWKHMMDRSAPNMTNQAWQRDLENGPPQYCSRTVYEDASPELLRDFFWDDNFRLKWDDMLIHAATIEECPTTGTMLVHWIRKFPFFCSDREYTIGRRIWESGRSYYCVTKGVPCSYVPRKDKPRRVDLYYSSWYIHAVESRKGNGELSACEVILFHHEDMGIPWEIAKFGVRQGMWGTVKKIEHGFRAYQKARASGAAISRTAFMAQINTKIDPDYLNCLEGDEESKETELVDTTEKAGRLNIAKLLIIGGAVVVACRLDRGLLAKGLVFGAARRFANIGTRACPRT